MWAYGLFALFIALGFHYTIAAFLPGLISIYTGYLANKYLVFNVKTSYKYGLLYYYLFYLVIYLINIAIQAVLNVFDWRNDYINGSVAIIISVLIAFAGNKWFFLSVLRGVR